MSNEQMSPPPGERGSDETTKHINELINTMGGAAVGGATSRPAEWTENVPIGVVQRALAGDPEALLTANLAREQVAARRLRRKAFFFRRFMDDPELTPASPADVNILDNIVAINRAVREPAMESAVADARRHLFASAEPDRFTIQDRAKQYAAAILNGAEGLDLGDLAVAIRASFSLDGMLLAGKDSAVINRASLRHLEFERAYLTELVTAVARNELFGPGVIELTEVYARMFGQQPAELTQQERDRLEVASSIIRDRLGLSFVIDHAGWWNRGERQGDSPYSRRRTPRERDELDTRAADTLERLHLLRRYGVTPFEVPGGVLQMPFDVAVEPPLHIDADGNPTVAEGAVADFIFIPPGQERNGTSYQFAKEENVTRVSIGGARVALRLRLHDNGQVSYGYEYHNIPSDNAQEVFADNHAADAFEQIRGLMIALAFDALVPDDVANARRVQSVANRLQTARPESPGREITDLLLRRHRVLERAGVRPGHTRPAEWEGPRREIGGYVKRLPEGCRPRPTANQEAIEYYRSALGIEYPGLPEGHTFVGPYDRRVTREVTFRRARFRRDAETRRALRDL